MTGEAFSPFYLLYIWIFVSYGTRYGKHYLLAGSMGSIVAFSMVVTVLQQWQLYQFELFFLLLLLLVLPIYQYSLLVKLHKAHDEAARASRIKNDFITSMSKELLLPLKETLSMASALSVTRLSEEQRGFLQTMLSSTQLLNAQIGNLLDLAQVSDHSLTVRKAGYCISRVLLDVCRVLNAHALKKGIELVCRIDSSLPHSLMGDEARLRQVLFNLIGNAVKYTDKGFVRVDISRAPDKPKVYIRIEDTGKGLSVDKLEALNVAVWKNEESYKRSYGGIGLGLTITTALIHLMDGKISVQSSLEEGTVFDIELPLFTDRSTHNGLKRLLHPVRCWIYEPNPLQRELLAEYAAVIGLDAYFADHMKDTGDQGTVQMLIVCDSLQEQPLAQQVSYLRDRLGAGLPLIMVGYPQRKLDTDIPGPLVYLPRPFDVRDLADAVHRLQTTPELEHTQPLPRVIKAAPSQLHILLAEHDSVGASLIMALLEKRGHRVKVVADGIAALEAVQQDDFNRKRQ